MTFHPPEEPLTLQHTESKATLDRWVACTCEGSQTLQSLDTRGYHSTTHRRFLPKLEGLARRKSSLA
ncbi:hypothetical protein DEO72_LG2g3224 [Vigna unguiculata]|uniref:Uncharacterized protein n=1 Tax=Vigna unguiculata TaxID=3917 RepID=A0A4D6L2Y8_VIGUN|nr:hypothetical protein DEO72_LG2g3224 [Vigna unguiculata]